MEFYNLMGCRDSKRLRISRLFRRRTFDHDHVDVDGADGWLRQSSSTVQRSSHVHCSNVFVWTLTVREQLPQRHA